MIYLIWLLQKKSKADLSNHKPGNKLNQYKISQFNQIAGLYKSFYNSFFPNISKNKPIRNALEAFTNNNNTFSLISIAFYIFIPILTLNLGLLNIYTNVNLQKTIRLALELFFKSQKYGQL